MTESTPTTEHTSRVITPHLTVVGIFEDSIDADHALSDLRKDEFQPETVSVIVRDGDMGLSNDIHESTDIASALASTGLDHAGDWLSHLVSLIVPDVGPLLAAGPMGAVLASSDATIAEEPRSSDSGDAGEFPAGAVLMALVHFGYGDEEAGYLASRVNAGSVLIGVTTPGTDGAGDVRRIFVDRNAVHVGTNWTAPDVVEQAYLLERTPVETAKPEDVVVLDSVGVLVGLASHDHNLPEARHRNKRVVDSDGNEIGTIDELLGEVVPATENRPEEVHIRYVVIALSGLLGIRRGRVAVPVEYVTLDGDPVQVSLARESLRKAPSFRMDRPFSRHEEEIICLYFGCSTYWTTPASGHSGR